MDPQKALENLVALVPPPEVPRFGTRSWDEVFEELGTGLPADFVALVERYGKVWFGGPAYDDMDEEEFDEDEFSGVLAISDPRAVNVHGTWPEAKVRNGDDYRDLRWPHLDLYQAAAWPEPGGYLSWGTNSNGDEFGWYTVGAPETWPIVVRFHGDTEEDERPLALTVTEFLLTWFSGRPALLHLMEVWDSDAWGAPRTDLHG